MFGAGMVLARGCASPLLVLSAIGNLRALLVGLMLTLVAHASLRGVLAPARQGIAELWRVPDGTARDLIATVRMAGNTVIWAAAFGLAGALVLGAWRHVGVNRRVAAVLMGCAVGVGWLLTSGIARNSFEVVPIASVSYIGPATDIPIGLVNAPEFPVSIGVLVTHCLVRSGTAQAVASTP